MAHKKGQTFRFKDKLVQDGYPDDTLYYVGSIVNDKKQRLLVLDGAGADVILIPENEVEMIEETETQKQTNVLVDIAQILKLMYHRAIEAGELSEEEESEEDFDEEVPIKKKRNDDLN